MFRIKICGVVQESDIQAVATAGADAVGLNFHPESIRYIDSRQAALLAASAQAAGLVRVGVFVDATANQIMAAADEIGLDYAQLHGQQTLADAEELVRHDYRIVRVIHLPRGPLDASDIARRVDRWRVLGCPLLLDADVGDARGGMGAMLDWEAIGRWARDESEALQWGLAGGLSPEVVAAAIRKSGAQAIDVASGVESPRGKKSPPKITELVAAAVAAWQHAVPRST